MWKKSQKNQSKSGKEADENKEALHTNSNSPSLVMKEQSEKESKLGKESVQEDSKKESKSGKESDGNDDALHTNNDRQELEHNDLAADMIQTIINSQEQCSEGEIEPGAHYSMSEEAMMNMQVLANLATEGEVQWM